MQNTEEEAERDARRAQHRWLLLAAAVRLQTDRRLVLLFREGHDLAFDEIVRRYQRELVSYAGLIGPPDSADDVVQEAFERAYVALRDPPVVLSLKPWLWRIARNRALNHRRDQPNHEPLSERLHNGAEPAEVAQIHDELAAVIGGLKKLPRAQRDALVMQELEGLSHDQIAAALGSSRGAVRQLVFRGRTALRNGLGSLVPLPIVRHLLDAEPLGAVVAGTLAGGGATGGGSAIAAKAAAGIAAVALAAGAGTSLDGGGEHPPTPAGIDLDRAVPSDRETASAGEGPSAPARTSDRTGRDPATLVSASVDNRRGDDEAERGGGQNSQDPPPSGGEQAGHGGAAHGGSSGTEGPAHEPVETDEGHDAEAPDDEYEDEGDTDELAGESDDGDDDGDDLAASEPVPMSALDPDDDEDGESEEEVDEELDGSDEG